MKKCSTPSCHNQAHSAGMCAQCYNYIYRAMQRGVAWLVARRERIALWDERLQSIQSRSNVTHIRRGRRKAA